MINWLSLTDAQRKTTIDQAETASGINAKAIEKDWWVTLILKALFQSMHKDFMVFKGGTSLSKGWDLIARFSEDIDIALSPEAFNMKYEKNPTNSFVKKLKKEGCRFTSNELRSTLEQELSNIGLKLSLVEIIAKEIDAAMPDTDPQTLYVRYRSLYPDSKYLADEVKIEVSVRSTTTPSKKVPLQSLLNRYNPNQAYSQQPFNVECVEPGKTFLEKMFLLHEEFNKPNKTKIRTDRMSRHFYDLAKMCEAGIDRTALADHDLYDALIKHREQYSRILWVDYPTLAHSTINFLPNAEISEAYQKDYVAMVEAMIYETNPPGFHDIIAILKSLQQNLHNKYNLYPKNDNAGKT